MNPCEKCITYAMCISKSTITCPLVNSYVLKYSYPPVSDEPDSIDLEALRERWILIPDRLREILTLFQTANYRGDYLIGFITFYPKLRGIKHGESVYGMHHISDLPE